MSNALFPGGLAAALVFSKTLADVASTLPEDSSLTIISPNRVGIVPPNVDDSDIENDEVFDPAKNGTGSVGNDTKDSNVVFECAVKGGKTYSNAKRLMDAFVAAGGGETGLYAAQTIVNIQPLIAAAVNG
jgi:hypothetical protein